MAWILATHPDLESRKADAVSLAERAADLSNHQHPAILDTLAAAYAADGQYDKAVKTAEEALALTSAAKAKKLAGSIRDRLILYKARTPFTQELKSETTDERRPDQSQFELP